MAIKRRQLRPAPRIMEAALKTISKANNAIENMARHMAKEYGVKYRNCKKSMDYDDAYFELRKISMECGDILRAMQKLRHKRNLRMLRTAKLRRNAVKKTGRKFKIMARNILRKMDNMRCRR